MGGLCRLVSGIACSLGTVLPGQTVFPHILCLYSICLHIHNNLCFFSFPQRLFCTSAIRARR